MDPRLSGVALGKALIAGIVVASGEAVVFGLATTPAMFMSTITPPFLMNGAIMITASHLPFNRNGFKFFTANGKCNLHLLLTLTRPIPSVLFPSTSVRVFTARRTPSTAPTASAPFAYHCMHGHSKGIGSQEKLKGECHDNE
jgi:hypothetical protein